jgi:carbamoyltransferase
MKILGLNDGVVSGAAVIEDGRMLSAINEERLIRKKMAMGFPEQSIDEVLRLAKTTPAEIGLIAVATHDEHFRMPAILWEGWFRSSSSAIKKVQLMIASWAAAVMGGNKFFHKLYYLARIPAASLRKFRVRRVLRKKWGFECPIVFVDHHQAHAASAYYTSGFEDATVISLDGGGDGKSGKVFAARDRRLVELCAMESYDSMGNFYAYITKICGFKAHKHEGKITGLAAYGQPIYKDILARMIDYEPGGYRNKSRSYYLTAVRKIEKALPAGYKIEDLAASMQVHLEEVCVKFVQHWVRRTGLGDVAMAGGVVANVKMNQRITEIPEVKELFVFPAMGDEGLATGAAYWLWAERFPKEAALREPYRPMHMFFGTEYTDEQIEAELKEAGADYEYVPEIERKCAELIADGRVVARFDGKMEYGPRALGNRSILYQPSNPDVNNWLNKRLVRTEFMPFAPVTLVEYAGRCYKNWEKGAHAARFMTVTMDCTDWMKKNCPAVVHVDGTARPQFVDREFEPSYYKIVDEYRKITGLPCLVNTSFNMHEEPIVRSPNDAIRAFRLGHLDYLAIGNFLVYPSKALTDRTTSDGSIRERRTEKRQVTAGVPAMASAYLSTVPGK